MEAIVTPEAKAAHVLQLKEWCLRHGYKQWNGAHFERTRKGHTQRMLFTTHTLRQELMRIQWGLKCPFYWETQREEFLTEITINPHTDKLSIDI